MKIVIYSLNDVVTKFIYWKKIVIDTLNDTHSTCNIVTIKFKGREGGLKNPCKLS